VVFNKEEKIVFDYELMNEKDETEYSAIEKRFSLHSICERCTRGLCLEDVRFPVYAENGTPEYICETCYIELWPGDPV
jgi:hypothetical protein